MPDDKHPSVVTLSLLDDLSVTVTSDLPLHLNAMIVSAAHEHLQRLMLLELSSRVAARVVGVSGVIPKDDLPPGLRR